ncbi:MAG: sigma 54-interacting transcriptional regulator [Bacillota bacterium]
MVRLIGDDVMILKSSDKNCSFNDCVTARINAIQVQGFGIVLVDRFGIITRVCHKMEKLLQFEAKHLHGLKLESFVRNFEAVRDEGVWKKVVIKGQYEDKKCFVISCTIMQGGKEWGKVFLFESDVNEEDLEGRLQQQENEIKLIGESYNFKQILNSAHLVAKTDSTVLLRGESGTGKELMARYIHSLSKRANKTFMAINCAAIPSSLMESELFGYVDGAFTGARKGGKIGLLEAADQGTIFFDEIAEMPSYMQVKVLRFLQEGTVRRIGDTKEKKLNVRIIAGTNRNIEKMVGIGEFREDLYYRINIFPIFIPPLRNRKNDISVLATYFINKLNKKLKTQVQSISRKALEKLEKHFWPGNIRELEHVIERSMILSKGSEIQDIELVIGEMSGRSSNKYLNLYLQNGYNLKQILRIAEKDFLIEALQKNNSIRKTARFLGVSHTAILKKMKKLQLD